MSWARVAAVVSILILLPGLLESFDTPKVAAIRVLGAGAIGAAVAAAVSRRRDTSGGRVPRLVPLDFAMLAWLAVEVAATVASRAPRLSLWGDVEQHEGLVTSLGLAGVYLAARLGTRTLDDARRTLALVVTAAAITAVYAVAQLVGADPFAWVGRAQYLAGTFLRPFGTLGHPNLLGIVVSAAWAMALAQALVGRRHRGLWALALLPLGIAGVATLSRGAWIALAAGSLAALLASRWTSDRASRSKRVMLTVWAGVAVAIAVFTTVEVLRARLIDLIAPASGASRVRLEIWRASLAMWRANPWLGVGPDAYGLLFQRFQTPDQWRYEWGEWQFHSHSIYLHALATRGLVGVGAAAAVLAALVVALRAIARAAGEAREVVAPIAAGCVALGVAGAFGALGAAGAALVAVLLGTVAALAARVAPADVTSDRRAAAAGTPGGADRRTPRSGRASARPAGGWRVPWVGLAAAALMVVPNRSMLLASHAAWEARAATPQSAPQAVNRQAALQADRAIALDPGNDRLESLRADVYLGYVDAVRPDSSRPLSSEAARTLDPMTWRWLAQAEESARRATRLEPQRALNYRTLGNVYLMRARLGAPGSLPAALETFRRCWALAPQDALNLIHFAFEVLRMGRPDLGLEPVRRAVALYPNYAGGQAVLGETCLALGDSASAAAAFERALALPWGEVPYPREELERTLASLRRP